MSFLDQIETEIEEDVATSIAGAESMTEAEERDTVCVIAQSRQSSAQSSSLFDGIKHKMNSLKDELGAKTQSIERLELELRRSGEAREALVCAHKKEVKKQLLSQKKEFEIVTQRHLLFIDRLLKDKGALSKKCEDLASEIKKAQQSYVARVAQLQSEHRKALRRAKEEWAAAEQLRREQWTANKTKQIKAMTIKGLEPEIQRLIEQNKSDLQRKDDECAERMRDAKLAQLEENEAKLADLKQRCGEESARTVKELKAAHFEELMAAKRLRDDALAEERARTKSEWAAQRERAQAVNRETVLKLTRLREDEVAKLNDLHSAQRESLAQKHAMALSAQSEKLRIEQHAWTGIQRKKLEAEFRAKEQNLMAVLKRQQRDEIEVIIDRMTTEFSNKMSVAHSKSDGVLQQSRAEVAAAKEKSKAWIRQFEAADKEHREALTRIEKVEAESHAKDVAAEELRLQIKSLRCEAERAQEQKRTELSAKAQEMRAVEAREAARAHELLSAQKEHARELKEVQSAHSDEIMDIERRIKQTLSKKDEWIFQLKQQIDCKNRRIAQIETLFEQ